MLAIRLSDIDPEGGTEELALGFLNAANRDSDAAPEPLEPGRRYVARIDLTTVMNAVPAGHRLRLSISPTHMLVWPSPEVVTLTIWPGPETVLRLPVRQPRSDDDACAPEDRPEEAVETVPPLLQLGRLARPPREARHDVAARRHELRFGSHNLGSRDASGATSGPYIHDELISRIEDDPLAARHWIRYDVGASRGDWRTRVVTESEMTSTTREFVVTTALDAYEGEVRLWSRRWVERIPRDLR